MKLKTLVGSLVALGMMSSIAHAAPAQNTNSQYQDPTLKNVNDRIAALEATVNRNQDNAVNTPASLLDTDWFKAITISGEFQPVAAYNNRHLSTSSTSSRSGTGGQSDSLVQNGSTTAAYMNSMELYLDGQVNNVTKVHAALDYGYNPVLFTTTAGTPNSQMYFSEANVQLANFAQSGLYSTLGQQFFNFGSFQHDSISSPLTELLAKIAGIGATGGYVSNTGFNASGYVLDSDLARRTDNVRTADVSGQPSYVQPNRLRTWGASAGYTMDMQTVGVNVQLDYLNNMAQTIYLSHSIVDRNVNAIHPETYAQRAPGIAAHVNVTSGQFGLILDYVEATKRFSANDLQTQFADGTTAKGAKPSAMFTQLDYNFDFMGHSSIAYAGYQTSKEAEQVYGSDLGGFYIPKSRVNVGYRYNLAKTTNVNVELDHDKDYGHTVGNTNTGSGRTNTGVLLGLDVKF